MTCGECKHFKECRENTKKDHTNTPACASFEIDPKRTNFARVAKSPETLAEFINDAIDLAIYHEKCFVADPCSGWDCERCLTEWLNQEAEDENENNNA